MDQFHVVPTYLLNEKSPDGYTWSRERLTENQASSRPDCLWPEIWSSMSKAARQCWKIEGHLFHRSGRNGVQGHHRKRAKKKTESPVESAMHCEVRNLRHGKAFVLRLTSYNNHINTDHRDLLSYVTVLGECWDDTHKSRSVTKFVLRPMSDEVVPSPLLTRSRRLCCFSPCLCHT